MVIPTSEEIRAAYEGITKDGPFDGPEAPTADLVMLVMTDPLLAETLARTITVLNIFMADGVLFGADSKEAFVVACLVKGLNLGLRIGEARAAHPRTGSVS